jgi:hypothetical protein
MAYLMNDPWTGKAAVPVTDYYGIAGSDILECIYYLPPEGETEPPPPPPAVGRASFGLHADARGGDISAAEVDVFRTAEIEMVKILSSHSPQTVQALSNALGSVRWVVRAFLEFGGRDVSPEEFYNWTVPDVARTLGNIPLDDDVVIELHNEPNLTLEGLGSSWADGAAFNDWYTAVLGLYRQRFPNHRFIFPGLSPGGDISGLRINHRQFVRECKPAIQASDGVGIHVYWSANYPLYGHPDSGVYLLKEMVTAVEGKPVWVTEASRNDGVVSLHTRADQYVQFWRECRALRNVQGVTYFVASAASGDFPHELWLENGQSIGLDNLVKGRA